MKTSILINNIKYEYRLAKKSDIDQVMEVIEDGRETLRLQGNGQWQDGYPNTDDLINDINNNSLYVIYNSERIVGVLALIVGDPEYPYLETGEWLSNQEFLVMHRCAIKKQYQHIGLGHFLFQVFEEVGQTMSLHSLRIDTHEFNYPMRHLLESSKFTYCGTIILKPNKHRVVYEKII